MVATSSRLELRHLRWVEYLGNAIQRRFRLAGNGLLFDNQLILKGFG
jgi:hypothetical protein